MNLDIDKLIQNGPIIISPNIGPTVVPSATPLYKLAKGIIRRAARNHGELDPIDGHLILGALEDGNKLCKGRRIPMSPQLITHVKFLYRKCQLELGDTTAVMLASEEGLADMVWGFIQCSKQTKTNLNTQEWGEPYEFLWLKNRHGETALDKALSNDHAEVAKLLLNNACRAVLRSEWESRRKILLVLLHDPKHDRFIFNMLEKDIAKRAELGLPPVPTIQELIVNAERLSNLHSYITSDRDRSNLLMELNHDLLGLNPNKNNFLHVASNFGDVYHVIDILKKHPSLISGHNSEGETPVYVAAREGHFDVLQIMFIYLKANNENIESYLIRPKDKHNALHIAIQNHHSPVVFLLLEEIPQLANHENISKESPLYLASERGYAEIVKLILKNCTDKSFIGPDGKTAVHAAAISNSAGCVYSLLQEWPDLIDKKDENDWTPLRYAVHYNSSSAVESLLYRDHSVGYQLVTQDNTVTSLIHIAASRGHCETMKVLMSKCLGSSEFIDGRGRNILHVAIESKQTKVIEFIFQKRSLTKLINQKDNNGNTPAHLLAATNFEMMQKVIDYRVNIHSLNHENRTPLDMIASNEDRERLIKAIATGTNTSDKISSSSMNDLYKNEFVGEQKEWETYFKIVDNMVLVVTLIATATFAAAFTVPGGFNSDDGSKQGTPYLLRKAAFQAFVVSNAIAFSCSCSVLLAHMFLLFYRNCCDEANVAEQKYIDARIPIMYFLTVVSLLAMFIAFVTGFYVVLLPSLWLAIFVCALSICLVVASLSY